MRVGAVCKELNVLPREGGVLDQPYYEVLRLEAVLRAFADYQELELKRKGNKKK